MEYSDYLERLKSQNVELKTEVALADYCSYGTGGTGKLMVFPSDEKQLAECANAPCEIQAIGLGSNVLFSDYGYDGVIINTSKMTRIDVSGATIKAKSGALLSNVRKNAEMNCLGGLEFTEGIPATVGGAICMNAGCFSKSISEYIAYVVTDKGVYNNQQCEFSYRSSIFARKNEVIVSACFILKPSETDIIESKKERFRRLRKNSQPHGKSCGSVFLNDGYFAGKLIDLAGLKGCRVGGAHVSEKHANFIIAQNATSTDVYKLINIIKKRVFETQNVKLKEELKFIGRFDD